MNDDESADAVREAELLARLDNEYIVKVKVKLRLFFKKKLFFYLFLKNTQVV